VVEAEDGLAGMKLFRDQAPDFVITDLIMPEQEGIQTIRELRASGRKVAILAVSGSGVERNLDYLESATKLAATETLGKPFRRQELLDAVTRLLATS
jgi:YesN/AraC family two-component response regulator